MLTTEQRDVYDTNGFVVVQQFLPDVEPLEKIIDELQGTMPYSKEGRWEARNCLPRHPIFLELLTSVPLFTIAVQLVCGTVKCLGSHAVKLRGGSKTSAATLDWHRDGGMMSLDLPDPLPPMLIKTALCVSSSSEADGGELLVVPGSHRLIGGDLPMNGNQPFGVTSVILEPGDLLIFDWRLWHAVSPNTSQVVRRMLYFAFGKRWMMPMDYIRMPQELLEKSPIHWQLLGGSSTQLGYYLPTKDDVRLQVFSQDM